MPHCYILESLQDQENFNALHSTAKLSRPVDRRGLPTDRDQYRDDPLLRAHHDAARAAAHHERRRVYGPTETRALAFIRRSRELGFTINEIRALLALSAEAGKEDAAEVRELAAATSGRFGPRCRPPGNGARPRRCGTELRCGRGGRMSAH